MLLVVVAAACVSAEPADETAVELTRDEFLAHDEMAYMVAYADCMDTKGWPGELQPDGGLLLRIPEEQEQQHDVASLECQDELIIAGIGRDPRRPPAQDLLDHFYSQALTMHECLDSKGFPTSDPPTPEAFHDMFGRSEHWDPWAEVVLTDRASGTTELAEVAQALCSREVLNLP